MKKLILVIVTILGIGMLSLTSCQQEDLGFGANNILVDEIASSTAKQSIEPDALPTAIQSYITDNYFDTYVENAYSVARKGFEVGLGTSENLYFGVDNAVLDGEGSCGKGRGRHGHGGHFDGERIDISELPASVTDYVAANYPDATIKKAGIDQEGNFVVMLSGRTRLAFDTNGTFTGEVTHEGRDGERIELTDLPAAITDYLASNYADTEAKKAKLVDDTYLVVLEGHIVVKFDSEGNFIEEATFMHGGCNGNKGVQIAIEDLPTVITDYITANFSTAEIVKAKQKNDGYRVGLTLDGERVILVFDADGNFLYQRG